jgi:hypothetical protein
MLSYYGSYSLLKLLYNILQRFRLAVSRGETNNFMMTSLFESDEKRWFSS